MRRARNNQQLEVIQSHLRGVRDLAVATRDEFLIYLIEMAYLEVSDRIRDNHASEESGRRRGVPAARGNGAIR